MEKWNSQIKFSLKFIKELNILIRFTSKVIKKVNYINTLVSDFILLLLWADSKLLLLEMRAHKYEIV